MEEGDEEAGLVSRKKKKGKVGERWLHVESSKTTKDTQNTLSSTSFIMSFLINPPGRHNITDYDYANSTSPTSFSAALQYNYIHQNLMPLILHNSVLNELMWIRTPKHFSCVTSCIFRRKRFKNGTLVHLSKVNFTFMMVLFPHFHSNKKDQTYSRSIDTTTIFSLNSHKECHEGNVAWLQASLTNHDPKCFVTPSDPSQHSWRWPL